MDVLRGHCEDVGRDPAEITKTRLGVLCIAPTHEQAMAKIEAFRKLGVPEDRLQSMMVGDPDEVAEQAAAFREAGIEGLTLTIPDVHDLETVALAGKALGGVFSGQPV
jgi:alkanesulfonate monooxygenase SsuD/methylene tetrahydromethanopterin reductase-like flavin-dependent oxidoreductase (luciferase family)